MAPINVELAELSDLFMLLAAFVYTVAFIVFAWDMAQSSKTIRAVEAELAKKNAKAEVKAKQLVGAGAPVADTSVTVAGADDLVDDDLNYVGNKRPIANVAVALTIFATALHLFAVIARGVSAHRVPWGNMYEFATTGALLISLVYLVLLIKKDLRFLGAVVVGLIVLSMTGATIGFPTPVAHLQPALQSYWLVIHVSVAVLSTALFTLTFAMSVLQLMQSNATKREAEGKNKWAFLRMVPSATALENWSYRINAVAFAMWTFTLVAGAIWAEAAWGRYWNWDTKEVWTFVIWVIYAGYLHARATRGWTGTRAAWLSIIGYAAVIFNFAVVNVFFPGLHSYAGIPGS